MLALQLWRNTPKSISTSCLSMLISAEVIAKDSNGSSGCCGPRDGYNFLADINILIALGIFASGVLALIVFRRRLPPVRTIRDQVYVWSYPIFSFLGTAIPIGIWLGILPERLQ